MKKVCLLGIVAILILSLCACHVEPPVGSTATAPSNANTTAPDSTTAPVPVDITPKTDGWVNIDDSLFSFFAAGGYYHDPQMGQQFLGFTDVSNGITVVLCSKPGCKHHEETSQSKLAKCDAYLGDSVHTIFFNNERIYYVSTNSLGILELYCRNADGTGKQKIAELGTQYVTPKSSISVTYYIPVGSKLYYKIDVAESVLREDGVYEIQNTKKVLMRCDLITGKEILIEEFTDEHPHMIAAREDQLLFYTVASVELDVMDPEYSEKMDEAPVCLKVWDESVMQTDILFEKRWKELQGGGFVIGSKYYYTAAAQDEEGNSYSGGFTYDLGTGQIETTDVTAMPIGGRHQLMYDIEEKRQFLYDFEKKSEISNEFASQGLYVQDQGDEGFILEKVYWKESTGGWKEADYIVYAYVTYDALADGLQSADCLDFLTLDR